MEVRELVYIRMPIIISRMPLVTVRAFICLTIPWKKDKKLLMATAEIIKGMPRPREYAARSVIPLVIVSAVLA